MEIILPDKHILFESTDSVRQITAPLKKAFNISTFSYLKINPDLSRIHLDTNYEWNKLFCTKAHQYYKDTELSEGYHWETGYTLLSHLNDKECIDDAHNFDIGDGLMFSEHQNGYTEMVFMALPTNHSPQELTNLLNHIDLLKKFIPYFSQEAKEIISEANKTPIVLPFLKEHEIKKATHLDDCSLTEFKNTVEMKETLSYLLTRQEMQCLMQLAKGLSAKEIARELHISYRTVEKHFENIKNKTGIASMKKLMALHSSHLQ